MSTLVIIGIGVLAWLGVCVIVVGLARAARRGDDALPQGPVPGSRADTTRRSRRALRRGDKKPPRTPTG